MTSHCLEISLVCPQPSYVTSDELQSWHHRWKNKPWLVSVAADRILDYVLVSGPHTSLRMSKACCHNAKPLFVISSESMLSITNWGLNEFPVEYFNSRSWLSMITINWMLKLYFSRKPEKETTRWFWWIWRWWIYSFNIISSAASTTPAGIYTTNGTARFTSCAWCTRNTSR